MKLLNQCWKSNEDQDTTCVLKTVKVNILHTVRPMKCSDNVDNIDNIWQFCGNVDNLFAKEWGAVSLFAHWTISFTKRPGDDLLRASLALVIYSYCVRAAKPSQALLIFHWGCSASIAGTALFDWQKDCQQYILNLNLFINVQIYFDYGTYGSAKVLTLITRHSIQHFQLLSKVQAGGRPKGASLDFRSSSLQINILLLCWQIWTNTIHLQSRGIAIGVEWTLIIAGSQPDL